MSYDGPSLPEWLAEYRARRPATEIALYEAALPKPLYVMSKQVVSLRIARYDDPDQPNPDDGIYLFTVTADGGTVSDTWHETVDDAFDQAEDEFSVGRNEWRACVG